MSELTVLVTVESNAENLDKTLYSLNHQNFQDFEIIIASNNRLKVEAKIEKKPQILTFSGVENTAGLINRSLPQISTKYTSILPCGDLLLFDGIKTRFDAIVQNQSTASYGLGFDTNEKDEIIQNDIYEMFYEQKKLPDNGFNNLIKLELFPALSSLMIKTEAINGLKFNESYKIAYTWDFFIRLFNKYNNITLINDPVYVSSSKFNKKSTSEFICFLKETSCILEKSAHIAPETIRQSYKNLFWLFYFMINTHFKNNKKPVFYLMLFYLKKVKKIGYSEFDFIYFLTLLNRLTGSKHNFMLYVI